MNRKYISLALCVWLRCRKRLCGTALARKFTHWAIHRHQESYKVFSQTAVGDLLCQWSLGPRLPLLERHTFLRSFLSFESVGTSDIIIRVTNSTELQLSLSWGFLEDYATGVYGGERSPGGPFPRPFSPRLPPFQRPRPPSPFSPS